MTNTIRRAVREGRVPVGMQMFSGSPAIVEVVGHAGFDFVMLDAEHTNVDPTQMENLIRAAEVSGMLPLVRVEDHRPAGIRKALEAGAMGVVVPWVGSGEEAAAAVAATRYPQGGIRGMCPATRASRYDSSRWDEFTRWSHEEVMAIPIIESRAGVENAVDICATDGVELIFFGPGDLGMDLGHGGAGLAAPDVKEAFDHVLTTAREHGVAVMSTPYPDSSVEYARALIEQGVDVLLHSVDELLIFSMCSQIIRDLEPVRDRTAQQAARVG